MVILDHHNGECRERSVDFLIDWKRIRNGLHGLLDGHLRSKHRGNDLGSQCAEDTGTHAMAQTISENDDLQLMPRLGGFFMNEFHMVAAQLFAIVVDALIADISEILIHSH